MYNITRKSGENRERGIWKGKMIKGRKGMGKDGEWREGVGRRRKVYLNTTIRWLSSICKPQMQPPCTFRRICFMMLLFLYSRLEVDPYNEYNGIYGLEVSSKDLQGKSLVFFLCHVTSFTMGQYHDYRQPCMQ